MTTATKSAPTVDRAVQIDRMFKISADLKKASKTLSPLEARFLVDFYYQAQADRIRTSNQIRQANKAEEPHAVLQWFLDSSADVESSIKSALGIYAKSKEVSSWAMSIHGIGPVIAAGLLAHIDITKAPTVGHVWRFAGLDPTVNWGKGEKRPWNASLKRLCWIIGGSFVKLRNSKNDIYGKVYEERKAYEVARNEGGELADQAKATLEAKRFKDAATIATYKAGKLPDGRIDARARRYTVKLFLSHYHHVAYEVEYGEKPPKPYIIAHGEHTHFIAPPKWG